MSVQYSTVDVVRPLLLLLGVEVVPAQPWIALTVPFARRSRWRCLQASSVCTSGSLLLPPDRVGVVSGVRWQGLRVPTAVDRRHDLDPRDLVFGVPAVDAATRCHCCCEVHTILRPCFPYVEFDGAILYLSHLTLDDRFRSYSATAKYVRTLHVRGSCSTSITRVYARVGVGHRVLAFPEKHPKKLKKPLHADCAAFRTGRNKLG